MFRVEEDGLALVTGLGLELSAVDWLWLDSVDAEVEADIVKTVSLGCENLTTVSVTLEGRAVFTSFDSIESVVDIVVGEGEVA